MQVLDSKLNSGADTVEVTPNSEDYESNVSVVDDDLPIAIRKPIYPYFVEFLFWFISCLPSCLVPTSTTWKTSLFLHHHHLAPIFPSPNTPGARITCELLNEKNFAAWSRSVRLFLGGKGKSGWLLGTITKPNATDPKFVQWEIDNCTILGWLFNSMEPRIYHVFMYHDMVPLLWSSLTKMYAHARNEARIFELYREIHQASQASLSLSVADYFAYLQSRWEELAQYEPLSEFTTEGGITARRFDRQHTYQFRMGLKPEFEALRTQIVNTTPMPSIFEAFAMLDGDERRHRLLQLLPPLVIESTIPDQMALAASGSRFSGGHSSSGRVPCSFCGGVTHARDRCFKLHPELRETFKRNKEKSKASPRTAAISETSYGSPAAPTAPDLHQLQTQFQNQMEQLQLQFQTQLGSLMQQSPRPNPSPSTATLASGQDDHMTCELSLFTSHLSSIDQFVRIADGSAVHVRSKGEICLSSQLTLSSVLYVPDFAYNLLSDQNSKKIFGRGYEWNGLYYFGDPPDSLPSISTPHSLNPRQGKAPEDPSIFSRPVPLFESPQVASPTLPPVLTSDPRHMHSRRPPASDPYRNPQSSPESGNISPISSPVRRYPTRDRRPPDKLDFSNPNATKHSIAQYVSYQGLSDSYRTFIGHVSSTPIPRSVSEALRDPNWVTAMQGMMLLALRG
ncbi:hypothetical protein Acr_00g0100900 [Actinidia rufa]|uniref:Retrotransposon Copia-like N-terminal domain-containing protein n=1 Tax=Actinidia rufa TaxID=165716 RepID=A0A7J0DZX1_9ERIC|nr:hypothetical protein Acr_00g0100900 [Actinidia rufa]